MPIEVNRLNKECPKCKNTTLFDTGKSFFCGKCLNEFKKENKKEDSEIVEILNDKQQLENEKTASDREVPEDPNGEPGKTEEIEQ